MTTAGVMDNYLQSRNTLEGNGRWIDSRLPLVGMFVNALSFMRTRLAGNFLHMREFSSHFAEILYEHPVLPGRIEFDFRLLGDNHLRGKNSIICIFNKDQEGFAGIRICGDTRPSNIYFVADAGGRFLSRRNLESVPLRTGWNRFLAVTDTQGIAVSINGSRIGSVPARFRSGFVGVRADGRPVHVDNICIENSRGETIICETFNHWRCLRGKILWLVVLLVLMTLGLTWRWHIATSGMKPIVIAGILAAGWWSLSYINFLFPSERSPILAAGPPGMQSEKFRKAAIRWTRKFPELLINNGIVIDRPLVRYLADSSRKTFHILCLVSSQWAGVGAASFDETSLRRLETALESQDSAGRLYECFVSQMPIESDAIIEFDRQWDTQRFDGLIVTFDTGHIDLKTFEHRLSGFLAENAQKIPILVVCAAQFLPVSDEMELWPPEVERVGEPFGVPVIDMHERLLEHADDGLLWWDYAHLTSFGQELMTAHCMETLQKFDGHFSKVRKT